MLDNVVFKGLFASEEKSAATATDTIDIKGFASISGDDRIQDDINPALFDVETYMKNPQLWIDHSLHQKYTADGSPVQVSIGRVKAMYVVRVKMTNNDRSFDLVDLNTGKVVDHAADASKFSVHDGIKGLWVKAVVIEPFYVKYVQDQLINAFSWQGSLIRRKNGAIKKIDLLEVSIVHTPMHPGALFTIGKSADGLRSLTRVVVYPNGELVERAILPDEKLKSARDVADYLVVSPKDETSKRAYFETETSARLGSILFLEESNNVLVMRSAHQKTSDGARVYDIVSSSGNTEESAVWSKSVVNELPDSSFAYIEAGGTLDAGGKTTPRSKRYFAIKNASGVPDRHQIIHALAQLPQSPVGEKAKARIEAAARQCGVKISKNVSDELTSVERILLDMRTDTKKDVTKSKQGGGEPEMNKEEFEEACKPILDAVKSVVTRADATDARIAALEKSLTPAAETKTETEAKSADTAVDNEKLGLVLTSLVDSIKSIDARMAAFEGKPQKSMALGEEDGDDDSEEETEVTAKSAKDLIHGLFLDVMCPKDVACAR